MANKTYSDARANLDLEYEMYAREKLTLSEVAEARESWFQRCVSGRINTGDGISLLKR